MTKQRKGYKKLDRDKAIAGYLFTLPSFIGFIIFVLIPLIWAANISLHQYNVFTGEGTFVGLKNYKSVFADARSIVALKNTIWYAVFCTSFNTITGLLLAVAINDKLSKKISIFFRAVYFFPSLVGLTFVAVIWQYFFQTDSGVVNYYLGLLHINKVGWLSNPAFSKISVLILDTWKNCGLSMLLILAGLQNISQDLLEAASIDGASGIKKFMKITLPLASPTIFFVLIINMTGALRLYESSYVLTNGGPGDSSLSLVMLIAEKAFTSLDYGVATSLSMMLLAFIGIVTIVQFVGSRWWVNYD